MQRSWLYDGDLIGPIYEFWFLFALPVSKICLLQIEIIYNYGQEEAELK